MSLRQDAPELKDHWLHASGGLLWHLRALRYRNTLWRPFRQTVQQWLEDWQPPATKLLIVGPSAGYTLNEAFLQRWREVVVLEPDPLARALLRRRYKSIRFRFEHKTVVNGGEYSDPFAKRFAGYAVLFVNVLGQIAPRTQTDSHRWLQNLRDRLSGVYWASYHDVISTTRAPDNQDLTWKGCSDITLDDALGHFWQGGELEIVDHACFGLGGGEHEERCYCVWPLRPGQYHLVEWLSGKPPQP